MKYARLFLIITATGLLVACSTSAETTDVTSPAAPSVEESAPETEASEPTPTGSAAVVAQMCDLFVAPEAPVPPEMAPGDAGGVETWTAFLLPLDDYIDAIKGEMQTLADSDDSQEAKDAYSSFMHARARLSVSILATRLSPPGDLTAEDIDTAWVEFKESADEMCPQWAGSDWPYQGETTAEVTVEPVPTVDTQSFSGNGDKVLKFDQGPFTVALTHSGSSNFTVYSLDTDLEDDDLLVNDIGKYKGTVLASSNEYRGLRIESDGKWTAEVTPIAGLFSDVVKGKTSGTGDAVFAWSIPNSSVVSIMHKGDRNFLVYIYTEDGVDLVVNEIGKYTGEQIMDQGIVEIQADGGWSLDPS